MAIDAVNGELTVVLAPWSITLIQLDMQEGMSPAPSPTSTPTAEPPPTSTPVPGVMPRIYLPTVRR